MKFWSSARNMGRLQQIGILVKIVSFMNASKDSECAWQLVIVRSCSLEAQHISRTMSIPLAAWVQACCRMCLGIGTVEHAGSHRSDLAQIALPCKAAIFQTKMHADCAVSL